MTDGVKGLKEYLKKEFGICTNKDLINACKSARKVDIGIFVTPIETNTENNDGKSRNQQNLRRTERITV
jgi:hypothetical protein